MVKDGANVRAAEPSNREEVMFMSGEEISMAPEVESMEVELAGVAGDQMEYTSWEIQVTHQETGEQPKATIGGQADGR